jgi:hypothetical protein
MDKNPGICMKVWNLIWNTFHIVNFFQIPTGFELIQDFRKTNLNGLWLIEILITNPSKLHFGQEVLHGDPKRLYYDMGDMYTLTHKIKEDIEFQRGINVKLNTGNFRKSGNWVN